MITVIDESERVSVPNWVTDLEAFRRWTDAEDFPEDYRIWWLKGEVWIDMSKEQVFTHVLVKTVFTAVLWRLSTEEQLGIYLTDGVLLSNFAADISGNPDGMFLSKDTFASDRIRLIEGKDDGVVEIQGSPDMVLEILSKSSEQKDKVTLKQAYWEAGIPEYWLVDARVSPPQFDIFRRSKTKYVRAAKQDDWVKSGVFGKSFRFCVRSGLGGHPDYSLEMR